MVTRGSKRRPRLPKAAPLDVKQIRQDVDYERVREAVAVLEGHVNDANTRIAKQEAYTETQIELISDRVTCLEESSGPQVVRAPVMGIALFIFIHDVAFGAIVFGAYWLARGYGWHLPAGWL